MLEAFNIYVISKSCSDGYIFVISLFACEVFREIAYIWNPNMYKAVESEARNFYSRK